VRTKEPGTAGFTFVEVMVVLLIIAALAGLIAPAIRLARRRADRSITSQEMTRLGLGVENFADQDPFADWPPATFETEPLRIAGSNKINEPIESLVLCLSTQRGEGPYFDFDEERLMNLDADLGPETLLQDKLRVPFPTNELYEYVDLWHTPYIYVPFRHYGKTAQYVNIDGDGFDATLAKDPDKGTWPAPLKFVLWSCGPDGINDNGGGDDIVSWR
jgi:prepilin-type N-terminal cleavage/methylation domain-containing protein